MKPTTFFCLACGKHHGGPLIITDITRLSERLTHKTCRTCRRKLKSGYTAFHCRDLNQTLWANADAKVIDSIVGTVVLVSTEQFHTLSGKAGSSSESRL
jgi:hypothetical protein